MWKRKRTTSDVGPNAMNADPERQPAPIAPGTTLAMRRHQASQSVYGIRSVAATVPATIVPGRRDVRSWWSGNLPDRPDEDPPPPLGEQVVSEREFPVRTLDGGPLTLRRTVFLRADGRRRKEFVLLTDGGAPVRRWPRSLLGLYAAERLGRRDQKVVVAEGAAATQQLLDWSIPSVGTLTGALGQPPHAALAPLRNLKEVILWPDNDEVGVRHMERLAARLRREGVRMIRVVRWVNGPFHGDAADVPDRKTAARLLSEALEWSPATVLLADAPTPPLSIQLPLRLTLDEADAPPKPPLLEPGPPAAIPPVDGGQPR